MQDGLENKNIICTQLQNIFMLKRINIHNIIYVYRRQNQYF